MADTNPKRSQRYSRDEFCKERQKGIRKSGLTTESSILSRWPSRPGQEQYEWEEPRVVADTTRKPSTSQNNREKSEEVSNAKQVEPGGGHCGALRESNRQAQPELGRTTNGTSSRVDPIANRVDRLRLLGNGVVPNTCERAIRILTERIK